VYTEFVLVVQQAVQLSQQAVVQEIQAMYTANQKEVT
jgi:hypothetical protein